MNIFYVLDGSEVNPKYPDGHLAEKLDVFINSAMDFEKLSRSYIGKIVVIPANTASAVQLAVSNEHLFTLRISAEQETHFLALYNAYQALKDKDEFINLVLSSEHPIGSAFVVYEQVVQQRLQRTVISKMKTNFQWDLDDFINTVSKSFLGEMKHHMQLIPNRCRVRVRYAHFRY